MAELMEFALFGLIAATTYISWQGFRNGLYFDKYTFDVDKILIDRQYYRLFSSGFLHGSWTHLIFNMASLYVFSSGVGYLLGFTNFITIYLGSKLLSSLLALYIHRQHGDYSSVGASGAVSGVIFSYIAMLPTSQMSFFFLPASFPAWAFGVFFMLVSIFGIKRQADNIGHEAHLGGAVAGVLLTILIEPMILKINYIAILAITTPAIFFLLLIAYKPNVLLIENYWGFDQTPSKALQKDYDVLDDETALNELLEKVSEKGYHNLNKQEKKKLEELSRKIES